MIELFHHGSSACAAKVRLALAEKQITWSSRYVDILRGEQFEPQFLTINPKGVVPVLVHDGFVIPESTVICEYLEEAFPDHPIYPRSPQARTRVRIWTKAVDEELHPACSALTYIVSHRHTIMRNGAGTFEEFLAHGANEGVAARTLKWGWIQQGLAAPGAADRIRLYDSYLFKMEAALHQGPWLVGDQFSMADIALTPYLNRLAMLGMQDLWLHGRRPRVAEWFERICSRPSFVPAMIDWIPVELASEMRANGEQSWPDIRQLLEF
jgi:ganglioside-induced differentiation-associated protein 1